MAKVLISPDDDLLRRIDHGARARGLTRSAYLVELTEVEARREALTNSVPDISVGTSDAAPLMATGAIDSGGRARARELR